MNDTEFEIDDGPCPECDGDGLILGACFEDSCCCADPQTEHELIPCPVCVMRPRP